MFITLNYHIINRAIRDSIAISEEAFEQQLDFLRDYGYKTLALAQAIDDIDGRQEAPPRSLLLTFDDGYADNVRVALPLLRGHDMRATLFVITGYIGQANRWNHKACYDIDHMSWEEIRLWHASGCNVGAHSHLHHCMTRLPSEELQEMVELNKRLLEENLGIEPRAFAYPYGRFNDTVIEAIQRHYEIAFATEDGAWDASTHRYSINRLTISPAWSIKDFADHLRAMNADNTSLESPH